LNKYKIECNKLSITVEGESRNEAVRNFFRLLKVFWYKWRDKLGQIAVVYDKGKGYPFRIVPSLYNMGLLDENTAVYNILRVLGKQPTTYNILEAKIILHKTAKQDEWMVA
jgi:hypothetical protein